MNANLATPGLPLSAASSSSSRFPGTGSRPWRDEPARQPDGHAVGMAIAIATTLALIATTGALDGVTIAIVAAGIAVGGSVGAVIARRVPMTAMPQLVASFHSLVGLAACLVATAAIYTPAAYGIAEGGGIRLESLIETLCGAWPSRHITFTGFGHRLRQAQWQHVRRADPAAVARHLLNSALAAAVVVLDRHPGRQRQPCMRSGRSG